MRGTSEAVPGQGLAAAAAAAISFLCGSSCLQIVLDLFLLPSVQLPIVNREGARSAQCKLSTASSPSLADLITRRFLEQCSSVHALADDPA